MLAIIIVFNIDCPGLAIGTREESAVNEICRAVCCP
jgi:hypothetical protein